MKQMHWRHLSFVAEIYFPLSCSDFIRAIANHLWTASTVIEPGCSSLQTIGYQPRSACAARLRWAPLPCSSLLFYLRSQSCTCKWVKALYPHMLTASKHDIVHANQLSHVCSRWDTASDTCGKCGTNEGNQKQKFLKMTLFLSQQKWID